MKKINFYLMSFLMAVACTSLFTACDSDDDDDDRMNPDITTGDDDWSGDEGDGDDDDRVWFECVTCKGRGYCYFCGGDGIAATGRECSYCDGSGVCHRCGGLGEIYDL